MKQIIIFAGTCASGKTTVIEKIKQGKFNAQNELDLDLSLDWESYIQYKHYQEQKQLNKANSDNVILHYDIYGERIVMQNDFDNITNLITEFDRVMIVTLVTSSRELRKRIRERLIKAILRLISNPRNYKLELFRCSRHIKVYKNYKNPNVLKNLYDDWFNYIKTIEPDKHWILNSDKKDRYDIKEIAEPTGEQIFCQKWVDLPA